MLFDIPLIGLFKAVRFESYPFHEAILLFKNAVSSRKAGRWQLAVSSYQLVVGSRQLAGEGWSDPKKANCQKAARMVLN